MIKHMYKQSSPSYQKKRKKNGEKEILRGNAPREKNGMFEVQVQSIEKKKVEILIGT